MLVQSDTEDIAMQMIMLQSKYCSDTFLCNDTSEMQPSPAQTVVIRIRLWRGGACCSHSSQPVGANRTLCCLQSTMSGHQVSIQSHGDGMRRRDDTLTLSAECPAACECLLPLCRLPSHSLMAELSARAAQSSGRPCPCRQTDV